MGRLIYKPVPMEENELDAKLADLKACASKVDHDIARSILLDAYSELLNEVHNIESGIRSEGMIGNE